MLRLQKDTEVVCFFYVPVATFAMVHCKDGTNTGVKSYSLNFLSKSAFEIPVISSNIA